MVKKKEIKNKKAIFAIGALVLVAAIGGVIAANHTLFPFNNNFTLGDFKTEVQETFDSPDDWKPCDQTQKTVTIKNTGTIDAEVRIGVNEQWISKDGDQLELIKDGVQLASYTLANSRWTLRDGYYYLDGPLAAGQNVDFLSSVSFNCAADFGENQMIGGNGDVIASTVDEYNGASYHLVVTAQLLQKDADVDWSEAFDGWVEPTTFATLDTYFFTKMRNVAAGNPIAAVKRSQVMPTASTTNIATSGSIPVYAWYVNEEEAIYLYSAADAMTLQRSDSLGGMFAGALFNKKATDVSGLRYLDTKNLTNIGGWFGSYLADDMSPLARWDLSGVTGWSGAFNSYFTDEQMVVVRNWKVPKNVSISGGMSGNTNITTLKYFKHWDMTEAQNWGYAFGGMSNLESIEGAEKFVGVGATYLGNMFSGLGKLEDISAAANWDVSSVTNFTNAFYGTTSLTDVCDLAGWNVSSGTDFTSMFEGSGISDASCLNNWAVSDDADLSNMFKDTQITDESKYPSWYTADRRGN